jgi:WD40 repeat protein/serine/threonine protein kinase
LQDARVWRVGEVVAGLYEVVEVLGKGGMGLVYRVRHLAWDVDLAVKSPRPDQFADDADRRRFVAEAQTWVSLGSHPHVCGCHYVRVLGGVPRVFAEYVEGGALRRWIDDRRLYQGAPADVLARVLDVAVQVAWGLEYAHGCGIVHQDVKPSNVLLDVDGTARITDFGLARARAAVRGAAADPAWSVLVTVLGMTKEYASPEQANGWSVGRGSDVFSFAVTVLELFTGEVTWAVGAAAGAALDHYLRHGTGDPGLPRMPQALAELLARCLCDDPAGRPSGMAEVATSLVAIYGQTLGTPYPRAVPRLVSVRADGLNNRGVSLLDLGRVDEAEAAFGEALAIDPHHAYSVYNAGVLRWRAGKLTDDELVARLESVRATSDDRGAAYPLALVHLERGDVGAALDLLDEAEAAPDHIEIAAHLQRAAEHNAGSRHGERSFTVNTADGPLVWASFTPDGQRALTGSIRGVVCTWDLDGGCCLATADLLAHHPRARRAAFIPNSRGVLVGHDDGTVHLWNLADRASDPVTLQVSGWPFRGGCFSLGDRYALTASRDHLWLWDVRSGECVATPDSLRIRCVCISSTGRRALTATEHDLWLWDIPADRPRRLERPPDSIWLDNNPTVACFSPDERHAIVGRGRHAYLLDLADERWRHALYGHTDDLTAVCVSPDGRWALTGSKDHTARLWDLDRGRCARTLTGHAGTVASLSFSPDGHRALTASADGTVRLWDLPSMNLPPLLLCRPRAHTQLANAQDRVARLVRDAELALDQGDHRWALATLKAARTVHGHERAEPVMRAWRRASQVCARVGLNAAWPAWTRQEHALSMAFLHDGRTVLTGGVRTATMWDVESGSPVGRFDFDPAYDAGRAYLMCFSDDGYALVAIGNKAHLWELRNGSPGRRIRTLAVPRREKWISSVCFGPGGGRLALTGSSDGTVRWWNLTTGARMRILRGHRSTVTSLCLSPNGRYALTGDRSGTILLWDLARAADHDRPLMLAERAGGAESLCFSPNGRDMAVVCGGGDPQVWTLDGSRPPTRRLDLAGHTGPPSFASFSPDGRYLLTGGRDLAPRLWDVSTGRCVRTLPSDCRPGAAAAPRLPWLRGGDLGHVRDMRISPDSAYACAITGVHIRVWALDWALASGEPRAGPT